VSELVPHRKGGRREGKGADPSAHSMV
jgi:hypothetical protein